MSWGEKALVGFIAILILSCLSAIGYGIYAVNQRSKLPTFTLTKAEWKCVETTTNYVTTNVIVGKVIVPQTQAVVECVNYVRK